MQLSAADDAFHPSDGSWWFHETAWFWFHVPERSLGAWIYAWVRPTIGVTGGGCYVWDRSTFVHWEAPYYSNHHNLRFDPDADLRNIRFPTGMRLEVLEPLTRYAVGFTDDDLIDVDLQFAAVMDPWVSTTVGDDGVERPHHLDQFGRVTGNVVLGGDTFAVDCLAMRDRTWARRSERWREGGGYGYTTALAESGEGFLVIGDESGLRGFLQLADERHAFVEGSRRVERHDEHGYPTRVVISARDAAGRELEAVGDTVSRLAFPVPGVHGMVWSSLTAWTINGVAAWGDDQEPWPIRQWSARRRAHLL